MFALASYCKLADSFTSVQLCWLYQLRVWEHSDFMQRSLWGGTSSAGYKSSSTVNHRCSCWSDLHFIRKDCIFALMPTCVVVYCQSSWGMKLMVHRCSKIIHNFGSNKKNCSSFGQPEEHVVHSNWGSLECTDIASSAFWLDYSNKFVYAGIFVFCYGNVTSIFFSPLGGGTDCWEKKGWMRLMHCMCNTNHVILGNHNSTMK